MYLRHQADILDRAYAAMEKPAPTIWPKRCGKCGAVYLSMHLVAEEQVFRLVRAGMAWEMLDLVSKEEGHEMRRCGSTDCGNTMTVVTK